jgi:hypothetical protein
MTPVANLQQLIDTIKADSDSEDALDQLATAAASISELTATGDAALGFFVDRARGAGKSWVEISSVLGVSKQAAHKRFADAWPARPTFERFTQRARNVLEAAGTAAAARNQAFVGTEHLLIGMYAEPDSVATKVLVQHGLTEESVRQAVEPQSPVGDRPNVIEPGHLPFTRRAAHVLQAAVTEAVTLGHNYVGTEHLLLAFYRDPDSVAGKILLALGLQEQAAWADIRKLLEGFTK